MLKNYILVGLLLTSGCASKAWYQEGKTQKQTITDFGDCKMLSLTKAKHQKEETALLDACMESKGYVYTPKTDIPKEWFDIKGGISAPDTNVIHLGIKK